MIKAIIFDCFGVLYPQASGNFYEKYKELFNDSATLDKLNLEIDLGEITRREFFKGLEKVTGLPARQIQSEIDNQLVLDQNLVDLIKKLKTKYKIGMLSNAGKEEISIIYRDKIDYLFDEITVSYEAGLVKPDPKIFSLCAQELGVKTEECMFVDDSSTNLAAAEKAKMATIAYPNFGHTPVKLERLA